MPLPTTFPTHTNSPYVLTAVTLAFSDNSAVLYLVDITYFAIVSYLEVSASALWASFISHRSLFYKGDWLAHIGFSHDKTVKLLSVINLWILSQLNVATLFEHQKK